MNDLKTKEQISDTWYLMCVCGKVTVQNLKFISVIETDL